MTETEEQPQVQQTVTMFSPEGKLADVPVENSDKAVQAGFKKAVTMTSPEGRRAYLPPDKAQQALTSGFSVGHPDQQPRVKMYDQDKNYKEIPANAQDYALSNGWRKGMEFTSPSGAGLTLHPDQAQDALNLGWKTGTPSQQPQTGFVTKTVGGMIGINSSDIANKHFGDSVRGKQLIQPPTSQEVYPGGLYQQPSMGTDTSTDEGVRTAGGINEKAFQKLSKSEQSIVMNEARVRAGMPWESKISEALPVAGSMIASGSTAGKKAYSAGFKYGSGDTRGTAMDLSEAAGHGGAALIPFFGAPAEQSGEEFGQGHIKEGLQSAGLALAPFAAEPMAKGAGAAVDALKPTPRSPLSQIIRPKNAAAFHEAEQTAAPLVRTAAAERGQPVKTVDDALDNIRQAKQNALIDAQNSLEPGQTVDSLPDFAKKELQEKTEALTTLEQHLTDAKKVAEEAKDQPTRTQAAGRVVAGATKMGAGIVASRFVPHGRLGLEMAGVGWGMRDIAGGIKNLVARRALTEENLNKVVSQSFSGEGPTRAPSPDETVPSNNQPVDTSAPVHETTPGPPDQPGGDLKIKTGQVINRKPVWQGVTDTTKTDVVEPPQAQGPLQQREPAPPPVKPAPKPLPVRDPVTGRMKSAVQPPDNASTPKETDTLKPQEFIDNHPKISELRKLGADVIWDGQELLFKDKGGIGSPDELENPKASKIAQDIDSDFVEARKTQDKKAKEFRGQFQSMEGGKKSSVSPPSNASQPVDSQVPQTESYPRFGSRADLLDDKRHQEAMRADLERHDRSSMKDFMEANTFPTTTKSERIAGYRNGEDASLFAIARAPETELRKFAEERNLDVTDSDNSLSLARKLHDSMTAEEVDKFNDALTNLGKKRENGYRNQALKEIAPGRRMSDLSDAEVKKVEDRAKQLKSQRGSATGDEEADMMAMIARETARAKKGGKNLFVDSDEFMGDLTDSASSFLKYRGEKGVDGWKPDDIFQKAVKKGWNPQQALKSNYDLIRSVPNEIKKGQRGSATGDELDDQLKKAMAGSANDTDYMKQAVKEIGGDRNFAQLNPNERTQAIARAQELKNTLKLGSGEPEILHPLGSTMDWVGKKPSQALLNLRDQAEKSAPAAQRSWNSSRGGNVDLFFKHSLDDADEIRVEKVDDPKNDVMVATLKDGKFKSFQSMSSSDLSRLMGANESKSLIEGKPKQLTPETKRLNGQRGSASEEDILDILKNFHDRTEYTPEDLKRMYSLDDAETEKIHDLIQTGDPSNLKREYDVKYDVKGQKGIPSPSFFSRGAQVADQKLPPVFSAEQARNTLKNAGISGDELKVANDWLANQSGKIKKADLVDAMNNGLKVNVVKKETPQFDGDSFLKNHPSYDKLKNMGYKPSVETTDLDDSDLYFEHNGMQLSETDELPKKVRSLAQKIEKDFIAARDAHGQSGTEPNDEIAELLTQRDHNDSMWENGDIDSEEEYERREEEIQQRLMAAGYDPDERYDISQGPTKYSEYQVPGGTNYREHLLQIPVESGFEKELNNQELIRYDQLERKDHSGELTSKEIEELDNLHRRVVANPSEDKPSFTSSHFDEPNVVAHARMNDRTDVNGKKTLFLEELQSDWHQQGREKGYLEPDKKYLPGEIERGNSNGVPDAPFKKDWPLLLIKHALREAVEKGQDQVAWTPGSVQAERYDLSRYVDSIEAHRVGNTFELIGKKEGNTTPVVKKSEVKAEDLSDLVGKSLAQKIIEDSKNGENEHPYWENTYTGKDLQVGGQGMKGFYDDMLPAIANKYLKKWGAKVETTEIQTSPQSKKGLTAWKDEETGKWNLGNEDEETVMAPDGTVREVGSDDDWSPKEFNSKQEAEDYLKKGETIKVPVIKINPSMRHDILRGQPISELSTARNTNA